MSRRILNSAFVSFIAISLVVLMSGVIFGANQPQSNQPDQPKIVGSIVATTNPGLAKRQLNAAGVAIERSHTLSSGQTLIVVDEDYSPGAAQALGLQEQEKNNQVKIYPNYEYRAQLEPNDPKYTNGDQWNLKKIKAPKAWDVTTGSSNTTIAVVDTGVLFEQNWGWDSDGDGTTETFSQPDFPTTKRWENPGETGMTEVGDVCYDVSAGAEDKSTNACDDDENGKIDDWQGWDFMGGWHGGTDATQCPNYDPDLADVYIEEDNDPQPYSCDNPNDHDLLNMSHYFNSESENPCDYRYGSDKNGDGNVDNGGACYVGHGTMAGSVASATTNNNTLLAGVDYNAEIMNLRVLDGYGATTTDRVTSAVNYATSNGTDIINLSLAVEACGSSDKVLEAALKTAAENNVIAVAASGNWGNSPVCFPASSSNVIAVGASNINDERASFSSYGKGLDLIAPGASVPVANAPSAARSSNYYKSASGTSFSSPTIAGALGLLKERVPDMTFAEAKNALQEGVDKISQMNGKNYTEKHGYGRLNVYKLLKFGTNQHPDGMLVKKQGSPHVFLIKDGKRQYIPSLAVFASHNFKWGEVKPATLQDMRLVKASSLDFREGALLKVKDGNKIYIVDHTSGGDVRKRHIGSPSVFTGLGFKMSEVREINKNKLPETNGPAVTSTSTHPDGVLVSGENSTKVYLIEDNNRRHVASLAVFASQGFEWGKIKEATPEDLELPTSSRVTFREGSLVKDKDDHPIYVVNYQNGVVEKRHVKTLLIYKLLDLGSSKLYRVNEILLPNQTGDPIR